MKVSLSVPSKTFLLGEYLALEGGPCLVANTAPRFELQVKSNGSGRCEGIHPMSQAGRFIRHHKEIFRDLDLSFKDPHEGLGGLGASSAQFVTAFSWVYMNQMPLRNWFHRGFSAQTMWTSYRDLCDDISGKAPSGADVVAQATGAITAFAFKPFRLEKMDWSFSDLAFTLVRTGAKVATHEHLSKLRPESFSDLRDPVERASQALRSQKSSEFVEAINDFGQWLEDHELVAEHSNQLLKGLRGASEVIAAKGCGAMGADILLLLHRPEHKNQIETLIKDQGLTVCGTSDEVVQGLHVDWEFSMERSGSFSSVIDFNAKGPEL